MTALDFAVKANNSSIISILEPLTHTSVAATTATAVVKEVKVNEVR